MRLLHTTSTVSDIIYRKYHVNENIKTLFPAVIKLPVYSPDKYGHDYRHTIHSLYCRHWHYAQYNVMYLRATQGTNMGYYGSGARRLPPLPRKNLVWWLYNALKRDVTTLNPELAPCNNPGVSPAAGQVRQSISPTLLDYLSICHICL